jgi:hypothetical protein
LRDGDSGNSDEPKPTEVAMSASSKTAAHETSAKVPCRNFAGQPKFVSIRTTANAKVVLTSPPGEAAIFGIAEARLAATALRDYADQAELALRSVPADGAA